MRDYYKVLGVPPNASVEEIQKAYRKKAFENHPDRNPGNKQAEARFREVQKAYEVLRDQPKQDPHDLGRTRRDEAKDRLRGQYLRALNKEAQKIPGGLYSLESKAEIGEARAQLLLGKSLTTGEGPAAKNKKKGFEWIRCAAEQGESGAALDLAFHYFFGIGVPEDELAAYAWILIANEEGSGVRTEKIFRARLGTEQIEEARKLSHELKAIIEAKGWMEADKRKHI